MSQSQRYNRDLLITLPWVVTQRSTCKIRSDSRRALWWETGWRTWVLSPAGGAGGLVLRAQGSRSGRLGKYSTGLCTVEQTLSSLKWAFPAPGPPGATWTLCFDTHTCLIFHLPPFIAQAWFIGKDRQSHNKNKLVWETWPTVLPGHRIGDTWGGIVSIQRLDFSKQSSGTCLPWPRFLSSPPHSLERSIL